MNRQAKPGNRQAPDRFTLYRHHLLLSFTSLPRRRILSHLFCAITADPGAPSLPLTSVERFDDDRFLLPSQVADSHVRRGVVVIHQQYTDHGLVVSALGMRRRGASTPSFASYIMPQVSLPVCGEFPYPAILNMPILLRRTPLLRLQVRIIVKSLTQITSTWADLQAMPGQDQPRKQHQVGNNAVM